MSIGNHLANAGGRSYPRLAIVRSLLLISAVVFGLFSMHVMNHVLPVESSAPLAQPHAAEAMPLHHAPLADPGHPSEQGCADCPMGHEMAAAGCVLALLIMLLFLRPPHTVAVARTVFLRTLRAASKLRGVAPNKPDLTALGICRT
ncbi:hypothetical protein CQ010_13555 [Arthrobacter sp. MYb211]|uniref:hypothetical protein n=1 Tax=Micrococcaceae TaxID=1268 RepID=UPI000BB6F961|nr:MULTISPECIES: hypothetical protein [Micrococcaceae]PCC27420.1 hypothetical protein CIK76_16830 [Glutamicibacter sp. BW80]PRA10498.1 hypothetical protein CQ015_13545 [Arthrobacter sp. MYb221]PRC06068.1 hypothetical protein CQ010_13555 [Arthrobacter sp. MYb211]